MAPEALVAGLQVGHAHDLRARTGCTVLLGPMRAAVDVRGMATGSRELHALAPLHVAPQVDAILLTGGSAFGLAAADGVMTWLEEHGHGFLTPYGRIPIVPAAVLYDLGVGDPGVRPDAAMGRAACEAAAPQHPAEGSVGAGCGATVGKALGPATGLPGGFGCFTTPCGEYVVSAVAAVNALGDVRDAAGRIIAGARRPDGSFLDAAAWLRSGSAAAAIVAADAHSDAVVRAAPNVGMATSLAAVVTDAPATRVELEALARMAATALPRRITPVYTPFDGDVVFAASTAREERALGPLVLLSLGAAAAWALEQAIERAVTLAAR